LGDPDQLPSVEAGDVLSGILAAAGDGLHLSASDARALQPLLGEVEASATAPDEAAPFPARHVHLVRGWRQSAALDLAPLAAAVRWRAGWRALPAGCCRAAGGPGAPRPLPRPLDRGGRVALARGRAGPGRAHAHPRRGARRRAGRARAQRADRGPAGRTPGPAPAA